jgi:hypothetical protein
MSTVEDVNGLNLILYSCNADKQQKIKDFKLEDFFTTILNSVFETNITANRLKNHVIKILGGYTRQNIDILKEENLSISEENLKLNDKIDQISVERDN